VINPQDFLAGLLTHHHDRQDDGIQRALADESSSVNPYEIQTSLRFTLEEKGQARLSRLSGRHRRILRTERHKRQQSRVGIVTKEDAEPDILERWFAEDRDIRTDPVVASQILEFIQRHDAKSVVMTDRIIGCPHEEGIDYPDGEVCPQCPFWAYRDRWTGEIVQ